MAAATEATEAAEEAEEAEEEAALLPLLLLLLLLALSLPSRPATVAAVSLIAVRRCAELYVVERAEHDGTRPGVTQELARQPCHASEPRVHDPCSAPELSCTETTCWISMSKPSVISLKSGRPTDLSNSPLVDESNRSADSLTARCTFAGTICAQTGQTRPSEEEWLW